MMAITTSSSISVNASAVRYHGTHGGAPLSGGLGEGNPGDIFLVRVRGIDG